MDGIPDEMLNAYKEGIPGKLKEIRRLMDLYREGGSNDTKQLLYIQVHKFAGSAGTYGFNSLSVILKEMEKEVKELSPQVDVREFERFLKRIEQEGF
jgi:HPt (histidine-containing phosphotransfer) domain-containing protein